MNDASRDRSRISPQAISKQGAKPKDLAGLSEKDDNFVNISTGYGPNYTKEGTDLIDKVAEAMSPAQWPLLGRLDATATAYEKRGWVKPAAGIRGLIASAQPPVIPTQPADVTERVKAIHPVNVLGAINRTVTASQIVTTIDSQWNSIESQIKQLPETHVPLLDAFPKFAEDFPRSVGGPVAESQPGKPVEGTLDDVKNLATAFGTIEQVVTKLATDLNRKDQQIEFAEFAKDPAVQLPAGGEGKITLAMYEHVPEMAQGYVRLPTDPRAAVNWNDTLDHVQKSMIRVITAANPKDKNLGTLTRDRDAVKAEVDALAPIAPIVKNSEQLVSLVTKAKTDLDRLTAEGNEWVSPYIIHPSEFIAQQRARLANPPEAIAKATPVVREQWTKADTALLDKVVRESAGLEVFQYDTYQNYVAKFKQLDAVYAAFDAKIPAEVAGLSNIQGADWRHAIAAKVAVQKREEALTDLMTNPALKWSDDLPQVDDPGYVSYARERLATYDQLRKDAISLIDDYGTILSRLDQLDLQKDEPAVGAPSWRALSDKWKQSGSPLLADGDIVAALRPITARVGNLQALDSITDYHALMQNSAAPAPEVAAHLLANSAMPRSTKRSPFSTTKTKRKRISCRCSMLPPALGSLPNDRASAIAGEMKVAASRALGIAGPTRSSPPPPSRPRSTAARLRRRRSIRSPTPASSLTTPSTPSANNPTPT